ncbi:MAG: endonuclease domain-containing protein [Chloroflexota bacterium]
MADQAERFDPDHLPSRLGVPERDRRRLQEAARRFRRTPTASEQLLWDELRGGRLGVKFRRQHPIGPVIVDFCCPQIFLIIEVDGKAHQGQESRDTARQHLLEDRGYHVLRLQAQEVEADPAKVTGRIASVVRERICETSSGSPPARMGEGIGG